MMTIIEKLESVRQTGPGRWLARCPAHNDKNPSLLVTLKPHGVWTLHCFTGCETADVLAAIGLTFTDLYPPTDRHHGPRQRQPFNALDVLRAVSHEATVAAIACADVVEGRELSGGDLKRVLTAYERIRQAVKMAEVR